IIERDSSFPGGYINLAEALAQNEQWQEAIAAYRQAIVQPNTLENHSLSMQGLGNGTGPTTSSEDSHPANGTKPTTNGTSTNGKSTIHRSTDTLTSISPTTTEHSQHLRRSQHAQRAQTHIQAKRWHEAISLSSRELQSIEAEAAPLYQAMAEGLRAEGRHQEAIQCYRKLAMIQPESSTVFANLGSLYATQQQWKQAISAYQQAIALDAEFAGAYRNLAKVWEKVNNAEAASECWYHAFSLDPHWASIDDYCMLGKALAQQKRWQWAQSCFEQVLTLDPSFPRIHYHLGTVLAQQGETQKAIAHLSQAIQEHPDSNDAYRCLGQLFSQQKHWKQAIHCLQRSIELEPEDLPSLMNLKNALIEYGNPQDAVNCYEALTKYPSNQLPWHHHLGDALLSLRQWEWAIKAFRRAIHINPNLPDAHRKLGHACAQQGNSSEGIEHIKQAIVLAPDDYQAYVNLGDVYTALNQFDDAILAYRQALSITPDHSYVTHQLAIALRERSQADADEAAAYLQEMTQRIIQQDPSNPQAYQKALTLQPNSASLHYRLAQCFMDQEDVDAAVAQYHTTLDLLQSEAKIPIILEQGYLGIASNRRDAIAQTAHQLGDALLKLRQWDEAIASYRCAIEHNPSVSWSYNNLGDALIKQQRWDEAIDAFTQATHLNPNFHWSWQNLGDALFKLERWNEAIVAYDQAIMINPDWYWSYYNRGNALSKVAQWESAIASYQEVIEREPGFSDAHCYLGDALAQLACWDDAITQYHQALECSPEKSKTIHQKISETLSKKDSRIQLSSGVPTLPATLPRFCIVTPVYNGEQYIDDTIYSIVTQAGDFVLRYHVQDGQSTDRTLEKIKAWENRLRSPDFVILCQGIEFSYESQTDKGMYDAINQGFQAIGLKPGDYMTWLNADDRLAPGSLSTVASIFGSFDIVQWIGGRISLMNEQGLTTKIFEPIPYSRQALKAGLHDGRKLSFDMQEGSFWRAELWNKAGGLNNTFRLAGDYDLWRRFAIYADLAFVDSVLASHRRHNKQLSRNFEPYHQEIDQSFTEFDRQEYQNAWDAFNTSSAVEMMQQGFGSPLLQFDRERQIWQLSTIAPTLNLQPAFFSSPTDEGVAIDASFGSGFGAAEGPYPTKRLPAGIRWTQQRINLMNLNAVRAGQYTLTLSCQTFYPVFVTLRLRQSVIFSKILPITRHERFCKVIASALLLEGVNTLELEVNATDSAHIASVLVVSFEAVQAPVQTEDALSLNPSRRGWPYEIESDRLWPTTLPNGQPWPKISIVTPSYNQGQFIEETILSVIHQDYPNLEYIVIDGNSTDETLAVIYQYRDHIHFILSEPDDGQSHALNKGFRHATGDILGWLNSDDRLAPGALFAIALAFHTSKADLVTGACQVMTHQSLDMQHLTACDNNTLPLSDLLDLERCWLNGQFFYQPEVFFTRDIWQRVGGYIDESLYYSMDYELWVRFASMKAVLHVTGVPIAQYRMHPQQKTSTPDQYKPELYATRDALQKKFQNFFTSTYQSQPQKSRLRIVMFNDVGFYGGAGIAHQRIASSLALAGHHVIPIAGHSTWAKEPQTSDPETIEALISTLNPDLLVLGNLHDLNQSIEILERLSARFPTIFVMHDQWLLTGRCAYTGSCEQYGSQCNADCPTRTQYPALSSDAIASVFERKRSVIQHTALAVFGNSQWMTQWAKSALVSASHSDVDSKIVDKFQTIHYGLDTRIFYPRDKALCREILDLPKDSFIVITGSQAIDEKRKGVAYLVEALEIENLANILLISFGHGKLTNSAFASDSIGYVRNQQLLAHYYAAADLFVGPSLEEAFGQTFIEAAACGTPAVGFAVGGVPDAIADHISGRLVHETTPQALGNVIRELYYDQQQRLRI
ncbi:MAG: tetratricopeptide repeat protein, partial [Cyanobacteria bacterium J06626_14]